MRSAPSDPANAAVCDHVCWAYDDAAAFAERAHDFLAAGIAAGNQVWYVAETPVPALVEGLPAPMFRFVALNSAYAAGHPVEPAKRVAAYRDATERAIAEGYQGLRVAADVTPLVRSVADLKAFARYEHLVDRYMTTAPLTGMCAYDRRLLGDRTIAELACRPAGRPAGPGSRAGQGRTGVVTGLAADPLTQAQERAAALRTTSTVGDGSEPLADLPLGIRSVERAIDGSRRAGTLGFGCS